jgi:hypothetical protein
MADTIFIMSFIIVFFIVINLRLDHIEKKVDDINKKIKQ